MTIVLFDYYVCNIKLSIYIPCNPYNPCNPCNP